MRGRILEEVMGRTCLTADPGAPSGQCEVPHPLPGPGTSGRSTILGLGVISKDGTSRPSDRDGTEPHYGLSVHVWVVLRGNLSCSPRKLAS